MGCCGGGGRSRNRDPYGQQSQMPQEPQKSQNSVGNSQETPMELLKQRLAKGEITLEEYEKLVKVLSS